MTGRFEPPPLLALGATGATCTGSGVGLGSTVAVGTGNAVAVGTGNAVAVGSGIAVGGTGGVAVP